MGDAKRRAEAILRDGFAGATGAGSGDGGLVAETALVLAEIMAVLEPLMPRVNPAAILNGLTTAYQNLAIDIIGVAETEKSLRLAVRQFPELARLRAGRHRPGRA